MAHKNYIKGRRREYQLINQAKSEGKKAYRFAGSHGDFDLVIINPKELKIDFIQVKDKKLYGKEKEELKKLSNLDNEYLVRFWVWSEDDKIDKRKKEFKDKKSTQKFINSELV